MNLKVGKVILTRGPICCINPRSVTLSSSTQIPADEIIFATGFLNMRDTTAKILESESAGRMKDVWGIDREEEVGGMWRWSGQKGFWYARGNLAMCRYYSKMLALVIKGWMRESWFIRTLRGNLKGRI